MSLPANACLSMTSNCGAFQRQMARVFDVGLTVETSTEDPLAAEIRGYADEQLRFAAISFGAHRTAPATGAFGQRTLVSVHQRGHSLVSQSKRTCRVGAGQMFLLDLSRPFSIETTSMMTYALFVDSALLRDTMPHLDQLTACAVDMNRGAGAILHSFVDELIARRETLRAGEAADLAAAVPYLVSASVRPSASLIEGGTRAEVRRRRATSYIAANLADPSLSIATIAFAIGMSRRSLSDLFAGETDGVMRTVWRLRLEQARKALLTPQLDHRSIGEIAFAAGFTDRAHFSRTFSARYGSSPRRYRRNRP